jgi:hypothetical protein
MYDKQKSKYTRKIHQYYETIPNNLLTYWYCSDSFVKSQLTICFSMFFIFVGMELSIGKIFYPKMKWAS